MRAFPIIVQNTKEVSERGGANTQIASNAKSTFVHLRALSGFSNVVQGALEVIGEIQREQKRLVTALPERKKAVTSRALEAEATLLATRLEDGESIGGAWGQGQLVKVVTAVKGSCRLDRIRIEVDRCPQNADIRRRPKLHPARRACRNYQLKPRRQSRKIV